MAAEDSKITTPDLKEIIASAVAVMAALALTLSNDVLRADQAMALAAVVPTLTWTVFITYNMRRMFLPKRSQAAETEEAHDSPDGSAADEEERSRWGIHRRWVLGIVTPIVIVIMLLIGYEVDELAGPGTMRIPAPLALAAAMAVVPWVVGLVSCALLVMPGGLIIRGLRQDPGHRASSIYFGTWIYMVTAFGLTAVPAGLEPPGPYVSPRDAIANLVGIGEQTVPETGWLWAARILFVAAIVMMPVVGVILASRPTRKRNPRDETAPQMDDDPDHR